MYSLRKWIFRPKRSDKAQLAQFYYADEALNAVASELDSFDGRKDPERCTTLVNQLRHAQDNLLSILELIMTEAIPPERRASRDFRVKFPDDVLQESLAGQLWFGAECLAAGSSILNREVESASMRPLARLLTGHLDLLRSQLREQCLKNQNTYTDKICEALIQFDKVFAEFELSYVSAMVPVKTMREYDLLQEVTVLFCETVQRALKLGLLTTEKIDSYDPALMFTIPRLAIVCGLLVYPEGPVNPDMDPTSMSEMFRPFQTLLYKIRELLWTLSREELWLLEQSLCSTDEPPRATADETVRAGEVGVANIPRDSDSENDEQDSDTTDDDDEAHGRQAIMVHSESTMTVVAHGRHDSRCDRNITEDSEDSEPGGIFQTMENSAVIGRQTGIATVEDLRHLRHSKSWPQPDDMPGMGVTGGQQQSVSRGGRREHDAGSSGGVSTGLESSSLNGLDGTGPHRLNGAMVRAVCTRARPGSREFNFNLPWNTSGANNSGQTDSSPHVTDSSHAGVDPSPLTQRLIFIPTDDVTDACRTDGDGRTVRRQVSYVTDAFCRMFYADVSQLCEIENDSYSAAPVEISQHDGDNHVEIDSARPCQNMSLATDAGNQIPEVIILRDPHLSCHPAEGTTSTTAITDMLNHISSIPCNCDTKPVSGNDDMASSDEIMNNEISGQASDQQILENRNPHCDSTNTTSSAIDNSVVSVITTNIGHFLGKQDQTSIIGTGSDTVTETNNLSSATVTNNLSSASISQSEEELCNINSSEVVVITSDVSSVDELIFDSVLSDMSTTGSSVSNDTTPSASSSAASPTLDCVDTDIILDERLGTEKSRVVGDKCFTDEYRLADENQCAEKNRCADQFRDENQFRGEIQSTDENPVIADLSNNRLCDADDVHLVNNCMSDNEVGIIGCVLQPTVSCDAGCMDGQMHEYPYSIQGNNNTAMDCSNTMNISSTDSLSNLPAAITGVRGSKSVSGTSDDAQTFDTGFEHPLATAAQTLPPPLLAPMKSSNYRRTRQSNGKQISRSRDRTSATAISVRGNGAAAHRQAACNLAINGKWHAKEDLSPSTISASAAASGLLKGGRLCGVGEGNDIVGGAQTNDGERQSSSGLEYDWDRESYCSSETSSYTSECHDDEEIAMAIQAAEIAARQEARSRFKSSNDLIHRLFVCISGVADQLQTNYASDLRHILKVVFECSTSDTLPPSIGQSHEGEDTEPSPDDDYGIEAAHDALRIDEEEENEFELDEHGSMSQTTSAGQRNRAQRSQDFTATAGGPRWIPDEQSPHCMSCKVAFTFVRRRHHCRNCGKIFCGRCSSNNVPLPNFGHAKPVRVCNHCYMFHVTPFMIHN